MATKTKIKKKTKVKTVTKKKAKAKKPVFSFNIDRRLWTTGRMLTSEGQMCALGFVARALKIPKENYLHHGSPSLESASDKRKWGNAGFLRCDGSTAYFKDGLTSKIISANDELTGPHRERELKKIFSSHNMKVNFITTNGARS